MQAFEEIARIKFGAGHLIAWMKIKVRERLSVHTEATNHGELSYQSDTHLLRIDSMTNIVNLAKFVDVDHSAAIEKYPMEFATITAFFFRGNFCYAVTDEKLRYFRDQMGFGKTILKGVESIAPTAQNGIHQFLLWYRNNEKEEEYLLRITTRLSDMSRSQEELARWKGCPRI